MSSILLVDDNQGSVDELKAGLESILADEGVSITVWVPTSDEADPQEIFAKQVRQRPTLVVADYDLTSKGRTGLFGSTIVEWCKQLAIPVGDYSRGNAGALPTYPDMFELRVPGGDNQAAHVAGLFRGFRALAVAIEADPTLLTERGPAAVLARVLGRPGTENQLSLYAVRIGQASGALMSKMAESGRNGDATHAEMVPILVYLVGHLLINSVLRFPGPIVSHSALCGLLATNDGDTAQVRSLFADARYAGPFSELANYYWLSDLTTILDGLTAGLEAETVGELNRLALERQLGRPLRRHTCHRCSGQNGGYFCPFTGRTVCEWDACSVASNSWIPQGAVLCRIERDFFDEWSPVLGF